MPLIAASGLREQNMAEERNHDDKDRPARTLQIVDAYHSALGSGPTMGNVRPFRFEGGKMLAVWNGHERRCNIVKL